VEAAAVRAGYNMYEILHIKKKKALLKEGCI
jgi:hypothetical protein